MEIKNPKILKPLSRAGECGRLEDPSCGGGMASWCKHIMVQHSVKEDDLLINYWEYAEWIVWTK